MIPARPEAVVFDLDGTLVDSRADIANAANYALEQFGLPTRPLKEIESYVGDGARTLLALSAGFDESDARLDTMLAVFIDYYAAHATECTAFMPGALDVLDELRDLPLALCTNKPRRTTDMVLAELKLKQRFAVVVAGGDLPERKPDPAPLVHIATVLGVPASTLVMVGDGAQDIEAARRAGARGVGVEGGIQPLHKLLAASPETMIGSLRELPGLVRTWRAQPKKPS